MNNELMPKDTTVECIYGNVKIHIDKYLLDLMVRRIDLVDKKFIRKKDAIRIYDMNEATVMKYAAEAGALYKRNKMVLIKVDPLDTYIKNKVKVERIAAAEAVTKQKNCFSACPWYPIGEDNSCRFH